MGKTGHEEWEVRLLLRPMPMPPLVIICSGLKGTNLVDFDSERIFIGEISFS